MNQPVERRESIYVEQGRESSSTKQKNASENSQNLEEVEVAEEATSEMAFQTLHQASSDISNRHDSSSHESSPAPQEIPLEDMSRKPKLKKKEQLTRARLTQSRLAAELRMQQEHSRSNSQSPKRKPSLDTVTKIKNRGRSTSLTTDAQSSSSGRSRSGTPERRTHSESNPLPASHSHRLKKRSREIQTQTTLSLNATAKQNISGSKSDTTVGASPKTLRPAPAPALSLVQDTDRSIEKSIKDSPKLMPPVDANRMRSFSEISQTSSEIDSSSVSSNRSSDSSDKLNLGLDVASGAGTEMSPADVKVEHLMPPVSDGKKSLATNKLTQLAQMVQQYDFDGENQVASKPDSEKS